MLFVQYIADLRVLRDVEFCKYGQESFVSLRKSATTQFRFSSVLYNRSKWCLIKFLTVCVWLAVYYQFSWQKQLVLDTVCVVEQSLWYVVSTCHGWNCDIVETQEHLLQNCFLSSFVYALDERAIGIFLSIEFRRVSEYVISMGVNEVMRSSFVPS